MPEKGEATLKVYAEGISKSATTWMDAGVEDGVRYAYRVKAVNDAGAGERSNFVNIRYHEQDEQRDERTAPTPTPTPDEDGEINFTVAITLDPWRPSEGEIGTARFAVNRLPLDSDASTTLDFAQNLKRAMDVPALGRRYTW